MQSLNLYKLLGIEPTSVADESCVDFVYVTFSLLAQYWILGYNVHDKPHFSNIYCKFINVRGGLMFVFLRHNHVRGD